MSDDEWDGDERRTGTQTRQFRLLVGSVEALSKEVSGLRVELMAVDVRRKRSLIWLLPIIFFVLYAFAQQKQFETLSEEQHQTSLKLAVGVCAMQNVVRIEIGNFLAAAQNRGVFDEPGDSSLAVQATAERQAFLTEARKQFDLVPCEALVAGENVEIRLEYPSTVPVTAP